MDLSLLTEESITSSFHPGCEGSSIIFPAYFRVLESCRSKSDGIAADHPLRRLNDTLQSALVLGSGGRVSNSDGAVQEGLSDGSVKVHYYWLRKVELLQLSQKVRPLLHLPC